MEKQKLIHLAVAFFASISLNCFAETTTIPDGYYDPIWSPYGAIGMASPEPLPPVAPCDPLVSTCATPTPSMHVAKETEFTTLDLFPPNISLTDDSCLGYCFVGTCFWVKCIFPGACWVETSVRFKHRNPDFVVSVYREPGLNPWKEIRLLYGWAQREVADASVSLWALKGNDRAGHGDTVNSSQQTRPLTYREVDVIGYPFKFASVAPEMFCETAQQPGVPAFMSAFDSYNWRVGLFEMLFVYKIPSSYIGGFLTNNWGNIFRRTGFINAYDDAKANAVIAHRAGNIISQSDQLHVYLPQDGAPPSTKKFFTVPGELVANSDAGGVFQMVAPKAEDSCHVFGQDSIASKWSEGRQSEDKASAFVLWRPYDCCETKGQYYLGTIESEICL